MPSLLDLPQEIRDKIYCYILAPTGTCHIQSSSYETPFTYVAWPSGEPINLSITEIDPSAAPIIVTHNIIRVPLNTFNVLAPTFLRRIQKLQIYFFPGNIQFQIMESLMSKHAISLKEGNLKELRYDIKGREVHFRCLIEPRDPYGDHYSRRPGQTGWGSPDAISTTYDVWLRNLLETTRKLSMETGVKARIDLELGVAGWKFGTRWRTKTPKLKSQEFVREMGDAFGGEVWIDGVLCWKDDRMVGTVFGDWKA